MEVIGQLRNPAALLSRGKETPAPGTHRIGGWLGSISGLDILEKRKTLVLAGNRGPGLPTRSLITTSTALYAASLQRCDSSNTHSSEAVRNAVLLRMFIRRPLSL